MTDAELSGTTETDDGDRYYEWDDGREYPSVTTILKANPEKQEAIRNWRENHPNPDHYRDRQGQLGRLVHRRVLNQYSIRELPAEPVDFSLVDEDFQSDVEIAVAMWDDVDIDPGDVPHVEVPVRNDKHEYAGRFDMLTTDGVLCDLKVSKQVREDYRSQMAAYWRAVESTPDLPDPRKGAIVRLHPNPDYNPNLTGSVEWLNSDQIDHYFDRFLEIQRIYRGE